MKTPILGLSSYVGESKEIPAHSRNDQRIGLPPEYVQQSHS